MSFTEQSINSIDKILSSSDYELVKSEINKLVNEKTINPAIFDHLQTTLLNVNCETNLLNSIGLLSLACAVPDLKNAVLFKLIELLRLSKMSNLKEICYSIMYCKFIFQITNKAYFPEMIKTVQNVLILFSKRMDYDKLFLPIYKLQKLKEKRYFLNFNESSADYELIKFDFKNIASIDFNSLDTNQFQLSLFDETLNLVVELKERYKQLEAFESIFYFVNKLLDQLALDYPSFKSKLNQIVNQIDSDSKPKLTHLVLPRQKPLILPMLEPNYTVQIKHSAREVEQSMNKKLKREAKSVQRELKKDTAFLSSVKLQETLEKDRIRKEKVKQLISEIQVERSMFKK